MINRMFQPSGSSKMTRKQKGVALFVSLVLLLVLTIVGVSAVQTTSLEERMARNTHDNVLAFQAAESALREAEQWVAANVVSTASFVAGGDNGRYSAAVFDQEENWSNAATWAGGNSRVATAAVQGVAEQPRYIIEWVATVQRDDNPGMLTSSYATLFDRIEIFRITARGVGGTANATVMLQSTFGMVF